jgi:uncharacterized protein (TIGR00725 family)
MQIAIIGSNTHSCSSQLYNTVYQFGIKLAPFKYIIISGGMGGIMEAVSKGIYETKDRKCTIIGILPGTDRSEGNQYLDIAIPTGIGFARNSILIASADVVIAFGGGAGTLSEIAFAWQYGKTVFCFELEKGWSKNLANVDLDGRKKGLLIGFSSVDDLMNKLITFKQDD